MEAPLLTTKLYVPTTRPEIVPRPHLTNRLNEGLHRRLSLVSAPAGFGKTTLLSAWAETCGRAVGWVSLDESDNDPARFWAYVVAALAGAGANVRPVALTTLHSPEPPSTETVLIPLLNGIAEMSDPLLLVLDDYHAITARQIHEGLAFFLDHQPPHVHLAIVTRADPPLPLARLRGRGQLAELYQRDLRFTSEEAADLLNRIMDLQLSAEQVEALERRTEGWIAGLQMAAVSMRGRGDRAAFVQAFSSSNRYVFDFLVEEVLQRQPPHIGRFLLRTSILDRLSGALCDAVVGSDADHTADSQPLLEYLERNNLFVVPLDDGRRWYRYHHLLADLLRQRLAREAPELVPELHNRASRWYEQRGLTTEAVHHAIASSSFERAAYLVQQMGWSIFTRGELTTVLGWIAALPDGVVRSHPELHVLQAWAMAKSGRLEDVESSLQAVAPHELRGEVAAVHAYVAGVRGQLPRAVELAEQALEQLPEENRLLRAIVAQNLGTAYHWSGDSTAASRSLTEAVKLSKAAGQAHQTLTAMAVLGRTYEMQGSLQRAAKTYREALGLASGPGDRPVPFAGMAYVGLAGPLYEWNHLDDARHCAQEGIRLSELGGFVAYQAAGCARLAAICEARGDSGGAAAMLQQAERLAVGNDYGLVRSLIDELRVRLWVAQGNVAAAGRWARAYRRDPGSDFDAASEIEQIAVVRVLAAQGKHGEAWDLLGRLLPAARASGRIDHETKLLVLRALTCRAGNTSTQALTILEQALTLGEPDGYVRTFVDEGEPMARLLQSALSQGLMPNYVAQLLAVIGDEAQPPASTAMIDPLTERELDVLRMVVAGLSNPEIAEALYIAISTVKTHVNHIYGKLGATHRAEAVARARELSLL